MAERGGHVDRKHMANVLRHSSPMAFHQLGEGRGVASSHRVVLLINQSIYLSI